MIDKLNKLKKWNKFNKCNEKCKWNKNKKCQNLGKVCDKGQECHLGRGIGLWTGTRGGMSPQSKILG